MHCSNPFQRVDIHDNGDVYCCCQDWLPRPIGNVLKANLVEIWEGEIASSIRSSILDQSFKYCSACPYLPGTGGPVVPGTAPDSYPHRLGILKLDYDRACNLACPSCRTDFYHHSVDGGKAKEIQAAILNSGALELTDQIYVSGWGDPLASPLYMDFLHKLASLTRNGLPRVFLHTNGLLLDAEHWAKLGATSELVDWIGISIDAASEKTYRVNRGGSWTKLWNNIDFINSLRASGRVLKLKTFFTFQANNYREMVDFVRLSFERGANDIAFSALHNWGTYSAEDYAERAVHLPGHPLHQDFLTIIADPIFTNCHISLIVK
jgi:radical SAM protein with 4Fe4S-binding SPASM domain